MLICVLWLVCFVLVVACGEFGVFGCFIMLCLLVGLLVFSWLWLFLLCAVSGYFALIVLFILLLWAFEGCVCVLVFGIS